jgi:hypothetical protein
MKTKRYKGKVGDMVAIGRYDGEDLDGLYMAMVTDDVGGATALVDRVKVDGEQVAPMWFGRDFGMAVTAAGNDPARPSKYRLLGAWDPAWGDADIEGAAEVKAAKRRARAAKAGTATKGPAKGLAQAVADICQMFGVESDALRHRLPADPKDADDMAHNCLRKFAIGGIAHLAAEAATGSPHKAIAEVPALQGIHRGTIASFRDQFVAFAGLGTDGASQPVQARSFLGRCARERYLDIRRTVLGDAE